MCGSKCMDQKCGSNVWIKCVDQMCEDQNVRIKMYGSKVWIKCVDQMCEDQNVRIKMYGSKCANQMCGSNVRIKRRGKLLQ
jgi:hypothetical protein